MKAGQKTGIAPSVSIAFCTALLCAEPASAQVTITETISPTFGFIMGGPANRRFVLDTNDSVNGPSAADYLFGATSGELVFQRQGGPIAVYIVVDNITTSGGVTANTVRCKWHNSPEVDCSSTGILETAVGRRRLLLGVDMTTTQFHNGGDTASISFDITATFL
jgi:hypothetical protein